MRYSFNDGWKFLEAGVDSTLSEVKERLDEFKSVQIPHDWLIYDSEDLYRNGRGWYERDLTIHDKKGKYFLEFDGVYMDSAVYVNDEKICEWKNGYSAFECDITDQIREGLNRIFVSVTHIAPNSRWYSGAGIYRNVCIRDTDETYIAKDGVYVSSREENGRRIIKIESEIKGRNAQNAVMTCIIKDADDSDCLIKKINDTDYEIENPHIWDIEDPYLYTLKAVMTAGEDTDEVTLRFGIRDIIFDPDKGFLLNGRKVKLNGVCEHHDLGALGAAFNKCAMKRKFEILKTMGVNALRTSHNMPAPEVLDLADEMGILVMSEGFDMWYMSKTDYDYSRFFANWHERDIESWIKQDRNHPSVIMWSIGNEILDCHADVNAPQITEHLADTVKKYDPYGNAHVTFASNYMPWKGAQKCADILKVAGYNYTENLYREHHEEHPDWIIYGSETSSLVQSRGVYHFPLSVIKLSDEDEQCSSLGNCITSWGAKSIENCICDDRDMDFSAGQFLWTGFDYIGEPTPYQTKNSYFGMLDTAGFPKDYYHVFKSAWTDPLKEPFVYIFPYWDFNPGQMTDVRVCSNEDNVELFFDGESLGKQTLTHAPGSGLHIIADYRLPYKEGVLEAVAYDKEGNISARCERKSFKDSASLKLCVNKDSIKAGSDDLIFAEISALDESGNPVANATVQAMLGSKVVDSVQTDAKGIYAFVLAGDVTYKVSCGGNPISVSLPSSVSAKRMTTKTDEGDIWENPLIPVYSDEGKLGGSSGNDIVKRTVVPPAPDTDPDPAPDPDPDPAPDSDPDPAPDSDPDTEPVVGPFNPAKASKGEYPYSGAVYDEYNNPRGIISIKFTKPSKGKSKISGTVKMMDGKSYSLAATSVEVSGTESAKVVGKDVKKLGKLNMLEIGEKGFVAEITMTGGTKLMAKTTDLSVGLSKGTDYTFGVSGIPSEINGLEVVSEMLPDGQEVPVDAKGKIALAKAATLKYAKIKGTKPTEYELVCDTSKGKTNLSGLKLTYTAKTSTIKGSFNVYTVNEAKHKVNKVSFTVNGMVIGGKAVGVATCKKPVISCPVVLE